MNSPGRLPVRDGVAQFLALVQGFGRVSETLSCITFSQKSCVVLHLSYMTLLHSSQVQRAPVIVDFSSCGGLILQYD